MRTPRFIWMLCAACPLAWAGCAHAFLEDYEFAPEQISEAGQEIIDRLAPQSFKDRYRFYTPEEVLGTFSSMHEALTGESVDALAAMQPRAQKTLATLRANPKTQDYADWLQARMDFIDMAAEVQRAIPSAPAKPPLPPHPTTPQKPLPPHPTTPQKPLPPHPTTPQPKPPLIPHPTNAPPDTVATPPPATVEKARNRYVESKEVWLRKLANRPAPARAAALLPEVKRAFRAEGVPPELVWQAEAESSFNPEARSPVGAAGLYQFMPATAQQFGLRLSPEDERLDAIKNARAAAKYLKTLRNRFGNWSLAFAAYNCGEGRVAKLLRETGGRTFDDIHDKLPAETRMYVPKIAALVQLRENINLDSL